MSDKIDMIYDLLKQDREEATDFRKEVRKSHKETGDKLNKLETSTIERLGKIESTNEIQNKSLDEHMRRTDILENLHIDNSKRITVLEEPGKISASLKKKLITTGKVIGAIVTIGSAVAYLLGLI